MAESARWDAKLSELEPEIHGQKQDTFLLSVAYYDKDLLDTRLSSKLRLPTGGQKKVANASSINVLLVENGSLILGLRLTTSRPLEVFERMKTCRDLSLDYTVNRETSSYYAKVAISGKPILKEKVGMPLKVINIPEG